MRVLYTVFLAIFLCVTAFAAESIGSIKKVSGQVTVVRGSETLTPEAGFRLFKGDIVRTSASSSAGIIFKDSTLFSLGQNSEVMMTEYVFEPKDEQYAFSLNMKKGSAVYESGRLGKLAPEAVKVHTPKATIGIRGTRFLVQVDE